MIRPIRHLLPVLLFVLAQQFAFVHVSTHAAQRLSGHADPAHVTEGACQACALYAPGAAALSPTEPHATALALDESPHVSPKAQTAASTAVVYRSRAPPRDLT
jgi:hypothetical protein